MIDCRSLQRSFVASTQKFPTSVLPGEQRVRAPTGRLQFIGTFDGRMLMSTGDDRAVHVGLIRKIKPGRSYAGGPVGRPPMLMDTEGSKSRLRSTVSTGGAVRL